MIAAAVVALLVVHDAAVQPSDAFGTRAALAAIGQYRAHVSPHLRGVIFCRFTPTCSAYGQESIRKYGLLRGGVRTTWRILRCGPWTKMGTLDPP
jgi:putative membrane protein insertion efficiency factor